MADANQRSMSCGVSSSMLMRIIAHMQTNYKHFVCRFRTEPRRLSPGCAWTATGLPLLFLFMESRIRTLTGDDFVALALLASLIVTGPALQLSFSEDLPALCEILTADFSQPAERDNAEPLHRFLRLHAECSVAR
jgi:hypothetical protein